ncbi:hypothetical protein ACTXT7_001953 [Hymenolepis weldensis]
MISDKPLKCDPSTECIIHFQNHSITAFPKPDCDGDTPLHDAVSGENLAMVELLLANRADLAITNSLAHNCLHHAAMLGNLR